MVRPASLLPVGSAMRGSSPRQHVKTHRQQFQCNLCNIDHFRAAAQLEENGYRDHDIPRQCRACDKTFEDPYVRDRHVKVQHSDSPAFKCPLGYQFQDATKLKHHEEICVLSTKRATKAIMREFAELCADTEDRNADCTQAFTEVRAEAQKRLECKYGCCGTCFTNKDSLKRHMRKTHKGDGQ